NLCFAPVIGNTIKNELMFTNSYYYIGHFSKFIRPGAKRISSVSSANNLITTAFKNVDGSIIVVVMNQGDTEINYSVTMNLKTAELRSLPHSIQTIVL
ncbi:MAG: glycoside hydrolase family 30 beta sandwich domain-containing protein, partial [Lutibacter sp.]|nr:glycoside hydrolase family 30 beta sandwich domain-containing protein [Lutibacter sp.]